MEEPEATEGVCPFCVFLATGEPLAQNRTFFAKYDEYPVSIGHVLLIPRRHIESLFDLNRAERRDFFELLQQARRLVQYTFKPDGFNVGVNVGRAAGQTIMHLHVHVIPRYLGDVEHPEGGVRKIIPNLREYPPQVP